MSFRIILCALLAVGTGVTALHAQTTYTWNFNTLNVTSGSNPNLTVSNFSAGQTTGSGINTLPPSDYSGASGGGHYALLTTPNQAGTLNTGTASYFSFSATPINGQSGVTVSNISFGSRRDAEAASSITIRSSADNFTTDLITPITGIGPNTWTHFTPNSVSNQLDSGSGVPIEFRIYGYNTGATAGMWLFDDFSITLTPVPEPGTIVGLGAVVMGVGAFRRRRFGPLGQPNGAVI